MLCKVLVPLTARQTRSLSARHPLQATDIAGMANETALSQMSGAMPETEYRALLLNHWRARVCVDKLREHDLSLSKPCQSRHRKRRRDSGLRHPMFDEPPPVLHAFDTVWPDDAYVEVASEEEEEEERVGQVRPRSRALPSATLAAGSSVLCVLRPCRAEEGTRV